MSSDCPNFVGKEGFCHKFFKQSEFGNNVCRAQKQFSGKSKLFHIVCDSSVLKIARAINSSARSDLYLLIEFSDNSL